MFLWIAMAAIVLPLGAADPVDTVDVPRVYGIASLRVDEDRIDVTKDPTLPAGLDLRKDGARVEKATVKVGESFAVTDGHHLGHSFKLIAIENGAARIQSTFWTSFLGREPTESASTTTVRSYLTKRKR